MFCYPNTENVLQHILIFSSATGCFSSQAFERKKIYEVIGTEYTMASLNVPFFVLLCFIFVFWLLLLTHLLGEKVPLSQIYLGPDV